MKTLKNFKRIALLAAILFSLRTHAQLTSCNIFLQGQHIEVGVNWNGAYGSSVAAPSSGYCGNPFHPKGPSGEANAPSCGGACYSAGQNVGFIADPDKDGWSTGTPYTYYGDYFLPGSPQEGWAIQADGVSGWTFNSGGCGTTQSTNITNSKNTSYTTSGNRIYATWEGDFNNIHITQLTTLDTSTVFFTVYMTLKNNTSSKKTNVYYLRTVDPDNCEPETGSFTTINKIEYQMPNSENKVLVSAVGLNGSTPISSAFLGLGTKDCRAKCFVCINTSLWPTTSYGPSGLTPGLDTMYSGVATTGGGGPLYGYNNFGNSNSNAVDTQDVGIGLVFKLGDIDPGDSITFAYAYILRRGDIDSAFESTSPKWKPVTLADSATHLSGDLVEVCAGGYVPLNIVNGAGFKWHWVSPTGNVFTDTVGLKTKVKIDSATAIIYAIGITPACQPDTQFIYLHPFSPPPPVVSSNAPLCLGETLNLHAVGIPNSYFSWRGPNGFTNGNANPTRLNMQTPDSGLYYLLDSIPGCPPQIVSTNVLVNAVVSKIGTKKPGACVDADFPVTFIGRASDTNTHYKWTFDNDAQVSGPAGDSSKGPYTLKWGEAFTGNKTVILRVQNWRCVSSDTIVVPVIKPPKTVFSLPKDACVKSAIPLTVADYTLVGIDSLIWDFGGGNRLSGGKGGSVGNVWINYNTSGIKQIILTADYPQCTAKPDTMSILVHDAPDATIDQLPRDICEGDTVTITAHYHPQYKYSWGPVRLVDTNKSLNNSAIFTIPQSQNIYVIVTDQYTCMSTDTLAANAKICCRVDFPSAFTPNGDGRNDYFKPITIGHHHIYHFKILNRYGQVVFESNDENKGWDGSLFGVPQDIDTYYWLFSYDCNGRKIDEKGDITLIR